MADVEIGEHRYRVAKMSVFDQAHVARKIAPVVFSLGRGYAQVAGRIGEPEPQPQPYPATPNGAGNGIDLHPEEELPPPPDPEKIAEQNEIMLDVFAPIADVLSKMEEQDVDYVLKKCLGVVSRFNGERFVPMMRSGNLMFEDLDLATLMQLTMEVVQDNLGPSLAALLPLNSAGAAYQYR